MEADSLRMVPRHLAWGPGKEARSFLDMGLGQGMAGLRWERRLMGYISGPARRGRSELGRGWGRDARAPHSTRRVPEANEGGDLQPSSRVFRVTPAGPLLTLPQVARRCWSGNQKAYEIIRQAMQDDKGLVVTLPHEVADERVLSQALRP